MFAVTLLMIVSIAVCTYCVYVSRYTGFNCYMVTAVFFLYYYLLPLMVVVLLNDGKSHWVTVAPSSISQAASLVALCQLILTASHWMVLRNMLAIRKQGMGSGRLTATFADRESNFSRLFTIVGAAFIMIGLAPKVAILRATGPSLDVLLRMSQGYSRQSGFETTALMQTLGSFFPIGLLVLALNSIVRRWPVFIEVSLVVLAGAIEYLLSGKRGYALSIVTIYAVWAVWNRGIRITAGHLLFGLGLLPIIAALGLVVRTVAPNLIAGSTEAKSAAIEISSNPVAYYLGSGEFTLLDFTAYILETGDDILLGEDRLTAAWRLNVAGFTYIIPRKIFPNKAATYTDMSQNAYYVSTGNMGAGLSIGWPGVFMALGGKGGLLLGSVLLGALCGFIDRKTVQTVQGSGRGVWLLVHPFLLVGVIFPLLRYGTFGFVWIDIYQKYLPLVLFILICGLAVKFRAISALSVRTPGMFVRRRR